MQQYRPVFSEVSTSSQHCSQSDRGGNLGGGVFPATHRREADRDVPLPRRGGIDQIQFLGRAQALEVAFTPCVCGRFPLTRFLRHLLRSGASRRIDVAHGAQFHARQAQQVCEMLRSLDADPDEAHPDHRHRLGAR